MTSPLIKPLLLVALVLVLPLVLLAFAGESFASFVERIKSDPPSAPVLFVSVVAILAIDVFLPVPSGPINTLAGSQLGIALGTLASTIGMTVGGIMTFALARRWGRAFAERFSGSGQLNNFDATADSHGLWLVLLTRPLPVLAEAAVLLMGTLQMSWQSFLPSLIGSNLLIATTYAILGHTASDHGWLPAALCLSIALPILITYVAKRRFAKRAPQKHKDRN